MTLNEHDDMTHRSLKLSREILDTETQLKTLEEDRRLICQKIKWLKSHLSQRVAGLMKHKNTITDLNLDLAEIERDKAITRILGQRNQFIDGMDQLLSETAEQVDSYLDTHSQ